MYLFRSIVLWGGNFFRKYDICMYFKIEKVIYLFVKYINSFK